MATKKNCDCNDFFNNPVYYDDQEESQETGDCCCGNGEVSPQARYNDYRNRMPFHYIDDPNGDGYYYWDFGATMAMEFTLENEFAYSSTPDDNNDSEPTNQYVVVADWFRDSLSKYIYFSLRDYRGNEIWNEKVHAANLIYDGDNVIVKFAVTEELSAIMVPNVYKLYIYARDESQDSNGVTQIVYNNLLTEQGISIQVRG